MEDIGIQIAVPGNHWEGRMTAEEKATDYLCTVRDYSVLHTFPGNNKAQGFELQEMGEDGKGSLEHGDASGEIFWIEYPFPYLTYRAKTIPVELVEQKQKSPVVDLSTPPRAGNGGDDASKPDMHSDYPSLRLSTAPVFKCFAINSDILKEMGPMSGQFAAEFECILESCDGMACGAVRSIFHKRGRVVSTTNLIKHVRERAKTCPAHKEALAAIEDSSKNYIELDGECISVYNFSESFRWRLVPLPALLSPAAGAPPHCRFTGLPCHPVPVPVVSDITST
jgi:hypothetical protein